jgi:alpha-tubulin suppressor-like RCC1 family protein
VIRSPISSVFLVLVAVGLLASCSTMPSRTIPSLGFQTIPSPGFQWKAVDAGYDHSCALGRGGIAYCWGSGNRGQLGVDPSDLTQQRSDIPIRVKTKIRFVDIGVGNSFSCGLGEDLRIYCWGSNYWGQLGRSADTLTLTTHWKPKPIDSDLIFESISVGYLYVCGVAHEKTGYVGAVFCWGRNNWGKLGNGVINAQLPYASPQRVLGGIPFERVIAGFDHTCALSFEQRVYCWGNNWYGQLGVSPDPTTASSVPVRSDTTLKFKKIAAGGVNTCGITLNGDAYCWGDNRFGQFGNSRIGGISGPEYDYMPNQVEFAGKAITDIGVGEMFVCAGRDDENMSMRGASGEIYLYCWGRNAMSEFPPSATDTVCSNVSCNPLPQRVQELTRISSTGGSNSMTLSVRSHRTCAINELFLPTTFRFERTTKLHCWGWGPLGDGSNQDSAIPVLVSSPTQ